MDSKIEEDDTETSSEKMNNLDLQNKMKVKVEKVDLSSDKDNENYLPSQDTDDVNTYCEEDENLAADNRYENILKDHDLQTGKHTGCSAAYLEQDKEGCEEDGNEKTHDEEDDGVPIDRGWAWMVTLGSFIIFLLVPGYNVVLSVLLLDIVDFYETSVTSVTIMQSSCCLIQSVVCQLTVNMLLTRMSVRLVAIIAAVANVATSLLVVVSPNMAVFSILQVIKFAVHGAMLTPSLALVGLYFKRRRALASSMALLGLSFASILVPLMVRYLREEYGFKGCFLIMSGYEMHGIFAASLLRPLSFYRRHRKTANQEDHHKNFSSASDIDKEETEASRSLLLEHSKTEQPVLNKSLEPFKSSRSESTRTISVICDHKVKDTCHCSFTPSMIAKDGNFNVPVYKNHHGSANFSNDHLAVNGHGGSLQTVQKVGVQISDSKKSLAWVSRLTLTPSLMASSVNFSQSQTSVMSVKEKKAKSSNLCVEIIKSILDFSLLKDYSSLICILSYIFARSGTFIAMYLPSYAIEVGLTKPQAAILVIIYGAVDMSSRVTFGYVGDLHLTQPRYIISITTLLMSVIACLGGLLTTFGTLIFFASALGLFGTVVLSLNTSNITEMVGLDKLGPVLAFQSLALTLSWTIQFPIIGVLIESTSNFASVFYLSSVSYVLATIFLLSDTFWLRCRTRGSKNDDL